jgi:hypothetical protein
LSNPSSKKPNQAKAVALSPVDALFSKYSESYQTPAQKAIHWACSLLIVFSLLGLAWSIPFPYLKFLGQYNGFFNWASFLIAAAVYYYYKTLPGLSYIVFIELFAFSYFVMKLDEWHKAGGTPLWIISAVIFIIAAILQSANLKLKSGKPTIGDWLKFMIISPMWVLHFGFKKKA